jgi:hypothetical protein
MGSKSSFFQSGPSATLEPVAINIPTPAVGNAGYFIRINLAGTAYEQQSPAQVQSDLGLPNPAGGNVTQYLRVNAGGTAYEARTTAQTQADIGLPTPGGNGLAYLRVNSGGTAYEVRTQAQHQADLGLGTGTGLVIDTGNVNAMLHGQCVLLFSSSTAIILSPKDGQFIRIQGKVYAIPSGGVTISNGSLSASTLYYAYLFNNAGTLTLELSTTTHATDTTAGNVGVEIKSGDASRTLVGAVKTNASSQFQEDSANLFVASWFNRRLRRARSGTIGGSTTSTTLVEIAAGLRVSFLSWAGEETLVCSSGAAHVSAPGFAVAGIGLDATNASSSALGVSSTTTDATVSNMVTTVFSEGAHFATSIGDVSVGTITGTFTVSTDAIVRI